MAALLPPEAPKVQLRLYTSAELSRATQNFARDRLIGQGATGEVFRGTTNGNNDDIAVKRLKLPPGANAITRQDLQRRFQAEFDTLATYQHVRLVRLLGWSEDPDPASLHPFGLVFELLNGGSLADWLRGPNGEPAVAASRAGAGFAHYAPLTALSRVEIAMGAVAGLGFLHGLREEGEERTEQRAALHRDVKSANIGLGCVSPPERRRECRP